MNNVLPPPSPSPGYVSSSMVEESEAPPQKKLKIDDEEADVDSVTSSEDSMVFSDEVNDTTSPIRPTYRQYDSEEDFCPYYPQKMDKAVWEKYYQQVKESEVEVRHISSRGSIGNNPSISCGEGFDITDYPRQCAMSTVYPMPNYLNDPKNADTMRDYARKPLKLYNDERGTHYEVNDVLKVNGGGCRDFSFFITISVKTRDGKDDIFQTKVVEDLNYRLRFPVVRPKLKAFIGSVLL